ncbi:MerR family transcriptional regulator [Vibrio sp.]|uniref:MerR family transcriptional regulator n=1 Tax=Vibrio viridaestus TaxID=2487322 RepID=A0A3N9TB24_9VIBR|nr:MerR family transcriptional regulator [Vibrio viridaestus]MDC0610044.1 MerR family transcriptional regulator [Vibrio sp.]RQW61358.1 MerR family transcriptional regulator [Vibrio viridaestus]
MNIKQFSQRIGLSPYTLRYYEKISLLRDIKRDSSGHRLYSENDIEWLKFIIRLKETGMPLERIKEYAELRASGDKTFAARQQLLEEHKENLKHSIEEQQSHLKALENKIHYYQTKINA